MHPDNVQQVMPAFELMATKEYTAQEWLLYYKNLWTRNLVARTIDVQSDTLLKAQSPEETVMTDDGRQVKVGERLELRKIYVKDALSLIKAVDSLLALDADKFSEEQWSEKALAVAEDMLPKKEEAAAAPAEGSTMQYKFLKDWSDRKAGDVIPAADLGDGAILKDLLADQTIELVVVSPDAEKKPEAGV